jgi:fumarate hydratase, class I
VSTFPYTDILPLGLDDTRYRLVTADGVESSELGDRRFLTVEPESLAALSFEAFRDISHLLRTEHLAQVARILEDPQASPNDRFVATELLRNACVAAGGVLPMCQDTGTAIIHGWRGQHVLTDGQDALHLSRGVHQAYSQLNLRYSQQAPLSMYEEKNTGTNLPAQIELQARGDAAYEFLFMAKGCGSANKTVLFQETPSLLSSGSLLDFVADKAREIGTSACPPYHLAVVIGGPTAEYALKTAKLASAHFLDTLPASGSALGHGFRDTTMEKELLARTQEFGIGAQFGGKYFCHDVRVVRLPRHSGSLPIAIAVSCAADRQARARIDENGVFLEELERDPAQFLPDTTGAEISGRGVPINLTLPINAIRARLSTCAVGTRLSLTGPLIVARDLAHAKIKERLDAGEQLPSYLRDHPVYYAGPAKTPHGLPSGSLGPTTAGRMDSYVRQFQEAGGSLIMLAKGNRSRQVTEACAQYGGFYLGSIGGPAARLAQDCVKKIEVLEYPELGMEAVHRIEVEDFPAFVVVDDKGNDFYAGDSRPLLTIGRR